MALNIAYFTDTDQATGQCYGALLSSAAYTVTASSASVGTPPAAANIARLKAGEACYVTNNAGAASASNGIFLAAGDSIDLEVYPSSPIKAVTG